MYHCAAYKLWTKSLQRVAKTADVVNVGNCVTNYTQPFMALKMNGLQLLFAYLPLSDAILTQYFKANEERDNKVSVHPPIGNVYSESLLSCTILSRNGSECFSFNSKTGMCRHYCSCDPSDMTINEAGWRLYDNLSPQWMGMYVISLSVSVSTCGFYMKKTTLNKYKQ